MPSFATTRRVRHSPENMFALVADVERYPEFVPLCEALRVERRRMDGDAEVIDAAMTVSYKFIRESFWSRARLDRANLRILVEYVDGPVRNLQNRWAFRTADGGCDVDFHIAYEFQSRLFQTVAGAVFDKAFRKFAEAFEARADALYGAGVKPANPAAPPTYPGEV
ncbi:MAG: SRPBCC family protein [Hyphomicrobiales bacterium]|nr:SRPBCC family protein [Hyphomicrobiales bacterium]